MTTESRAAAAFGRICALVAGAPESFEAGDVPEVLAALERSAVADIDLWAVRVLDAWAGCEDTEPAVRLARAEAVFSRLRADVRQALGEKPC